MTLPDPATALTGPDLARVRRILAVARRVGMLLLSSGAQTTEVEVGLRRLTSDLGLEDVQVGVFYSSIQLSYVEPGDFKPTTIVQMASDRTSDFTRLSDVTSLLRRVSSGDLDLEGAEAALTGIEQDVRHGPLWLAFLAPAISSGALAILLGGAPIDAAATFVIALIVLPVVGWMKRSGTPPFFSLLLGTAAATVLAALTARLGFGVDVGLLMAASLIQFLPGGALLSGVRDLIDQAVVSGTARLSEALLIAAGVASGAIVGIALSARLGVTLAIEVAGPRSWDPVIAMVAAAVAVAAYAYQVAVPVFALAWVALLGAMAWSLYALVGYTAPSSGRSWRRSPLVPPAASSRGTTRHPPRCGSCRRSSRCCRAWRWSSRSSPRRTRSASRACGARSSSRSRSAWGSPRAISRWRRSTACGGGSWSRP
jgi:uncharacterized membrane protein YjjP (DUF1212 family)